MPLGLAGRARRENGRPCLRWRPGGKAGAGLSREGASRWERTEGGSCCFQVFLEHFSEVQRLSFQGAALEDALSLAPRWVRVGGLLLAYGLVGQARPLLEEEEVSRRARPARGGRQRARLLGDRDPDGASPFL